jgi:hypothetical protein
MESWMRRLTVCRLPFEQHWVADNSWQFMVVLSAADVMYMFTWERLVNVMQITYTGYLNVIHGNVL